MPKTKARKDEDVQRSVKSRYFWLSTLQICTISGRSSIKLAFHQQTKDGWTTCDPMNWATKTSSSFENASVKGPKPTLSEDNLKLYNSFSASQRRPRNCAFRFQYHAQFHLGHPDLCNAHASKDCNFHAWNTWIDLGHGSAKLTVLQTCLSLSMHRYSLTASNLKNGDPWATNPKTCYQCGIVWNKY